MKAVQVSTWNVPCGIAGYTKGLVDGMSKHGLECDVLPIDRQQLKYMSRDEVISYFDSYEDKLLSTSYDIIHLQHEFSFFAGSYGPDLSMLAFNRWLKSMTRLRKPVFVTFHSEPSFLRDKSPGALGLAKKKRLQYLWKLQVAYLFNSKKNLHAVLHTKNSRRQFLDSGFESEKIHIVKQGVTFSPVDPIDDIHKGSIKEDLGFPKDAIVLAMFGFISAYKGYITAIKALEFLPKEYHLLIIGMPHPEASDGTFDEIVRTLERSKGSPSPKDLHSRVKLAGFVAYEELQKYYKVVDISLAPYKGDTNLSSSAAITWALSSGKPVIASSIPAFAELNEVSRSLQMVTPDTPGELAYRIKELITDSNLKTNLVDNALKYCESNQWSNIGKEHIELYAKFAKVPR
jgi:glycosyltransferase involved in cell wall biosynthesis